MLARSASSKSLPVMDTVIRVLVELSLLMLICFSKVCAEFSFSSSLYLLYIEDGFGFGTKKGMLESGAFGEKAVELATSLSCYHGFGRLGSRGNLADEELFWTLRRDKETTLRRIHFMGDRQAAKATFSVQTSSEKPPLQ